MQDAETHGQEKTGDMILAFVSPSWQPVGLSKKDRDMGSRLYVVEVADKHERKPRHLDDAY